MRDYSKQNKVVTLPNGACVLEEDRERYESRLRESRKLISSREIPKATLTENLLDTGLLDLEYLKEQPDTGEPDFGDLAASICGEARETSESRSRKNCESCANFYTDQGDYACAVLLIGPKTHGVEEWRELNRDFDEESRLYIFTDADNCPSWEARA